MSTSVAASKGQRCGGQELGSDLCDLDLWIVLVSSSHHTLFQAKKSVQLGEPKYTWGKGVSYFLRKIQKMVGRLR
jgi:hypothetical protein